MASRLRFSAAAAYRHLRTVDPKLGRLIERVGPYRPRPSSDPYSALVRAILYQQLAGAAARAIHGRVLKRYRGRLPTPRQLLRASDEQLRALGLSRQKSGYLRDLASHLVDGSLDFDGIDTLSDDEVSARLTAVRGIGEWSAHMFLLFELGRPDVLPVGDLGVRKGMQLTYGLAATPAPKEALEIGRPWAPYRSVGSWYMWRAVDTATPDET